METWSEFALIDWIRRRAGAPHDRLGIGDDASAWSPKTGQLSLVTCDALVEGVHFERRWSDAEAIGRKAAVVSISDIAAMGGIPERLWLTLALPPGPRSLAQGLAGGVLEACRDDGLILSGGDTVASPGPVMVAVTVQGRTERTCLLTRKGARAGDVMLMTGEAGGAAAGLAAVRRPGMRGAWRRDVRTRFLAPRARVREGRWLAQSGAVTSMIDSSDGLAGDVRRLAEAGGVGVRMHAAHIPVSLAVRAAAARLGAEVMDWVLAGGEDYELVFTCRPRKAADVIHGLPKATGTPCSIIGEVLPRRHGVQVLWPDGRLRPLRGGWEHRSPVGKKGSRP